MLQDIHGNDVSLSKNSEKVLEMVNVVKLVGIINRL